MDKAEISENIPDWIVWRDLALVLALAFIGAVAFQGSRGIYETTEGRYAECARETLASGNWDDPILNGQPHWTKPPLTYLAIMGGMHLLGNNPWGVRAYLVVAMVLAAGAIWWAGRSIWNAGAGRWAGVVFATAPAIAGAAHVVSADMLTVLWLALAIAAFWHAAACQAAWAWLGMWGFLGLALLTKGPPALLVPGVVLPIAWWIMRRGGTPKIDRRIAWGGLALFLLVGVSWFACKVWHTPGLLAYWIGDEMVGRTFRDEFDRDHGFMFVLSAYVPTLLLGTGPWIPLILWRGRPVRDWWRSDMRLPLRVRAARAALAAGVVIPFAVFAFSKSKMPLYVVPLLVPLCLGLGRALDVIIQQGRLQARTVGTWAGVLLVLIVTVKGAWGHVDRRKDMTRLAAVLQPVLARDEFQEIYTVSRLPRNGLEFHLERKIDNVQTRFFLQHMASRAAAGEKATYIVGRREWVDLATQASSRVSQVDLGKHWLLISAATNR